MAKLKAVIEFEFDSGEQTLEECKAYLGDCWENS